MIPVQNVNEFRNQKFRVDNVAILMQLPFITILAVDPVGILSSKALALEWMNKHVIFALDCKIFIIKNDV